MNLNKAKKRDYKTTMGLFLIAKCNFKLVEHTLKWIMTHYFIALTEFMA